MVNLPLKLTSRLEARWDQPLSRSLRSISLVAVLLGGVALVEVFRLLGEAYRPGWMPRVHLAAISWAIGLLLVYELVEMAFAIGKSVSRSVARYLQLYALVLLRDAFLKLDAFPEPIRIEAEQLNFVGIMTADAAGGIALFVAAGFFAKLQRHTPITADTAEGDQFIRYKKLVTVALLGTLGGLCTARMLGFVLAVDTPPVLETYFTVLVFVDVLLAFISLAFSTSPAIVFRDFGFAFAALLLRISLASPGYIRPSIGVVGGLAAIVVTIAYNLATDAEEAHETAPNPGADPAVVVNADVTP